MKLRSVLSLYVLVASLSAPLFVSGVFAGTGELDEVTKGIRQKSSQWSAQQTSISKLPPEERKKRLGSKYPIFSFHEQILTRKSPSLPTRLDWRNYNGNNYVTPVKEQGDCGACWAFAVSAALESKTLITQNTPNVQLDLSEQVLTTCSNAGDCDAGYINAASDFISNYGLPPEYCQPFTTSNGSCANSCPDLPSIAYTVSGWSLVDPNVDAIKDALYHYGPLVALMAVNTDFFYYGSGIYSHAWGGFEGYHAALIVGYDDINQSFIVKSSWGTDWGEAGYYRIAYGEIGSETVFGCWLIAYEKAIPADFPLLDDISRYPDGVSDMGKEEAINAGCRACSESGAYTIHQTVGKPSDPQTAGKPDAPDGGDMSNESNAAHKLASPLDGVVAGWEIFECQFGMVLGFCSAEAVARQFFTCDGSTYGPPRFIMGHYCPGTGVGTSPCNANMDWEPIRDALCAAALAAAPGSPCVDVRTEAQKAGGCCPPQFPECLGTGSMGGGNGGPPGSGGPGSGGPGPGGSGPGSNGPGPGGSGPGPGPGSGDDGGRNDGSPNVCIGSAANIKSGNLYFTQDAAGLTLAYNSIDTYDGPVGKKWTHNYNVRLTPLSGASTIKLTSSDGNIIFFVLKNGVYYPEAISGDTSQIVKNTDGSYTQISKYGVVYNFNASGYLISITDRNGNTTSLTYSGNNLAGITTPSGRTTVVTTTGGLITSLTDPGGRTYSLAYSNGLLASVTDPLGNAWQYTYDATGRILTKRDPAGRTVTYTYDIQGRLLTATDPNGRTRTMAYTQMGATTVTEKDGGVWTYQYDPKLVVTTQKTDPLGNVTRYAYNQNHNLTSSTDPDGSVTSYTYDANSNLLFATYPLGRTTSYVYNSMNLVTSSTDPKGGVTAYGYDANGNLTSVTTPSGAVTAFQYDTRGNVTAMTDPNNRTMAFAYDAQNNLTSITDPPGNATGFTYDAVGNRLSMTDPMGHMTQFAYNSLNQMTQVTDPKGNITRFTYDYEGNILSTTDANGRPTQYEYNYRGQLTRITDALNKLTQLSYGPTGCGSGCGGADKLAALTDALNHITRYNYDLAGRLTKETDPQARETNFTYDARGNLLTRIKPDGRTITYTYDAANRLTQKRYPGGSVTQYQYDANGNMTYAGNAAIAYTFSYDVNNRLTGVTDSNNRTIQYQYDAAGNKTATITPENRPIAYGYDAARRLTSITADSLTFTFGYDANSRRTSLAMPNGTGAGYTYDNNGNLMQIRHTGPGATVLAEVNYTYDPVNNRLTRTDAAPSSAEPAGTETLTYGTANELLTLNATTYGYDLNGNRTQKTEATGGTTTRTGSSGWRPLAVW
jgi:YD repeat-containing protein